MTLSISFYNGIKYTKDDFLKRDQDFFGNGVVKAEHFPYTLASTPDMTIQIGTGVAWVDGYRIENDAPITFTLQPPGDQPRIDIVQIGHDDFHACAVLEVKTGVPGHTESIPAADPKFVELYAIYVNPGVVGITAEDVVKVFSLVPLQVSGAQISFQGVVSDTEKGQPDGVASLDAEGRVPVAQIPALNYVPASEKGEAEGIATLNSAGFVPLAQLPPLNFVPMSVTGQPNGVATLDSLGKVPTGQIPVLNPAQALTYTPVNKSGDTMSGALKVVQSTNLAGLTLEGATPGFASGLVLNNTSDNAGRKYSIYSNSDGALIIADETDAATRMLIKNTGDISVSGTMMFNAAQGTMPFQVASSTKVSKLNADQVDGYDLDQSLLTTAAPTFAGLTSNGKLTVNGDLAIGHADEDVQTVKSVTLRADTRTTTLVYAGQQLTQVIEQSDSATVKMTNLSYNNGQLTSVQETAGGTTVTSTFTYVNNMLSSITKAVN